MQSTVFKLKLCILLTPIVQIWEDKFMSPKPSSHGRQGLQGQEDNSVVPMGQWSYRWALEIWTGMLSIVLEDCDSWEACSHFPPAFPPAGSLNVMSNCWLLAEWLQHSSNCWVRLRRTGCHVQQLLHKVHRNTLCRGTQARGPLFSAEVEEDI